MTKKDSKRPSPATNSQPVSKKQNRKGENPVRVPLTPDQSVDNGYLNSWVCKNSACRAVLSTDDTFCKRCSCCICHLFDDNKDPSLWLVCSSESPQADSCGLSCHIECALQRERVGVVDHGQLMQLDGSYCCASCGKVSGILGYWKKQLVIARDARRVDVLCYRIYLSDRLLHGSSRFKELHDIVKDAKAKLEAEVGPVNGVSAQSARGIVSRLSVAGDLQKLCSLGIEKAEEWLNSISTSTPGDSLPAACRFIFEEVKSSSVTILLIDLSKESPDNIKGYKLWYFKSREETHTKEPVCVFPKKQRRILICNLQSCTEYTFRIISYTDAGDLGHSEAKCFTKSIEILEKKPNSSLGTKRDYNKTLIEGTSGSKNELSQPVGDSSGFKVRDLGNILRIAWHDAETKKCCEISKTIIKPENNIGDVQVRPVSRGLDLNIASVPDLNEELTPPFESSRDEDNNGCMFIAPDDDVASHDIQKKNNLAGSHGSGDSLTGTVGQKRAGSSNECDSTLIEGSPFRTNRSGCLDENFEYCVKIIRWLECEGHLNHDFRLKLLTWFSLRSTEQERRVVNAFIHTLIDDPSSLAGQLVDSFSDIISNKKAKNGFCSKLWH
ncbi:hypothetical protein ACFE04_017624 [Oxalis oulophora]